MVSTHRSYEEVNVVIKGLKASKVLGIDYMPHIAIESQQQLHRKRVSKCRQNAAKGGKLLYNNYKDIPLLCSSSQSIHQNPTKQAEALCRTPIGVSERLEVNGLQ